MSPDVRKLLYLDVGLMNKALDLKWSHMAKLSDRNLCNEGPIAEQFVGQQLLHRREVFEKPALFYWLREEKTGNAEVDFIVDGGRKVIPVEVKSGKSGSLKSLRYFMENHDSPLAVRFDLNKPVYQQAPYPLLSLPLYLAGRSGALIEKYLDKE
jgi:predicted AAA+ superfamily ATPase